MVNSIKNNPVLLEQLAKAYMERMSVSEKPEAGEGAAKNPLALENAENDTFVSSNGSTETAMTKDEVMEMLLDMSDAELNALMTEYGIKAEETGKEEAPKTVEEAKKAAEDAEAAVKGSEETTATEAAAAASSLNATTLADGEDATKIQEEIDALEEEKDANYEKIEKIETEIEALTKKAEENIMKAAKVQEEKVAEHEEESQAAVEENINAYVEANKEGGKGMTRKELQDGIKSSLSKGPEEPLDFKRPIILKGTPEILIVLLTGLTSPNNSVETVEPIIATFVEFLISSR